MHHHVNIVERNEKACDRNPLEEGNICAVIVLADPH